MTSQEKKYSLLLENSETSKSPFLNKDNGDMTSPKPNYRQMSLQQLRRYVLAHRDDDEAWQEFTHRERPNAIYFDTDLSLLEQQTKLQELLQDDR
jgi:hypothetical protein